MEPEPDVGTAIDQVEAVLRSMSRDPCASSRLAGISTLRANGEYTWVTEIAYQLMRAGTSVRLEPTVYAGPGKKVMKADLVIAGEVFEVKSTFTAYARTETEAATRKWLIEDVLKQYGESHRGHQIITVATMAGATYTGIDSKREGRQARANEFISDDDRKMALRVYRQYAHSVAIGRVRSIDLGRGTVPGSTGQVRLDALLFCMYNPES
jgi:hypothetical protein